MNNETKKIANAILRGKQNNDYFVINNNKKESLQDFLAEEEHISKIIIPYADNNIILTSNPFDISGLPHGIIITQNSLYNFEKEFNQKNNFLDEDIKKFVVDEFNKYTFSDNPELKRNYFLALGTANYINSVTNSNKDINQEIIKHNSNNLIQLIDNIIKINPENLDEKYDEQTFRESINSRKTILKNKIISAEYNINKIFVASALLSNVLGEFGHNLRKKEKTSKFNMNSKTTEYLKNNDYLLNL